MTVSAALVRGLSAQHLRACAAAFFACASDENRAALLVAVDLRYYAMHRAEFSMYDKPVVLALRGRRSASLADKNDASLA